MKLNWAERWVVNNPMRVMEQKVQMMWMKKVMPLKPGKTVLEIGAGRGAGARLIVRDFAPDKLIATDLDARMLKMAQLSPAEEKTIRLGVADAENLPFPDSSMDAVFGFGFLHHVPNWRKGLAEVARVLIPGGVYYMEEIYPAVYLNVVTKRILAHPHHDRFESHDLKATLNRVGLPLRNAMEHPWVGILGVCVKSA